MKDIQSDKAVNYIINQIKKLEKNVDEYKYEINSIELELKSICNVFIFNKILTHLIIKIKHFLSCFDYTYINLAYFV